MFILSSENNHKYMNVVMFYGGCTMDTLGNRIKSLRNYMGYTQNEFAEKLNVTQSYLSKVEKDKAEPTEKVLKLIAFTFNCSLNWLKGDEYEEMFPHISALKNPSLVSDLSVTAFESFNEIYENEDNLYLKHCVSNVLSKICEIYNHTHSDFALRIDLFIELERYVDKFYSLIELLANENNTPSNKLEAARIMTEFSWNVVDNISKAFDADES